MTILTPAQTAAYWTGAGGATAHAIEFVAIATAESSRDPAALSPAGAIGLWQDMPFNAALAGGTPADLYNPAYNAKVAVILSSGGVNCAAWDTCYANIQATGRYSFLAWPEKGSAAYDFIGSVGTGGGVPSGHIIPPAYPGITDTAVAAAADIQAIIANQVPVTHARLITAGQALGSMFGPGWRP